jgi:hypothetical protein
MGHADVAITTSIYTHLYGREEAERAFREAMSSRAVIGNSLAGSDHDQPGLATNAQRATKPN